MNALSHTADDSEGLDASRRIILFPTDFGPAAQKAWSYALDLAQALAAELLVLHMLELVPADFGGCGMLDTLTVEESLRRAAEGLLERMRGEAAAAGVTMRTDVIVGSVRTAIVRAARDARVILIVMGTSGREGLRRAILGSVAEWVVGHAPCPVWTVRHAPQPMAAATAGEVEPTHDRLSPQRSMGV
jgi:universal stress protein A